MVVAIVAVGGAAADSEVEHGSFGGFWESRLSQVGLAQCSICSTGCDLGIRLAMCRCVSDRGCCLQDALSSYQQVEQTTLWHLFHFRDLHDLLVFGKVCAFYLGLPFVALLLLATVAQRQSLRLVWAHLLWFTCAVLYFGLLMAGTMALMAGTSQPGSDKDSALHFRPWESWPAWPQQAPMLFSGFVRCDERWR